MRKTPNVFRKIINFVASLGTCLFFVYVILPLLTDSVGILNRMSLYLADNGIDPTRYYYTDVEQVKESEHYLEIALGKN